MCGVQLIGTIAYVGRLIVQKALSEFFYSVFAGSLHWKLNFVSLLKCLWKCLIQETAASFQNSDVG